MNISLVIGDNPICSLEPGKRYALQIFVPAGTVTDIIPQQTDSTSDAPNAKFPVTPDDVEGLVWSFDGVADASAGFEFIATRRELTFNSSAALLVDVECYPIQD